MDPQELRQLIASARTNQAEGYERLLSAYGTRLYGYFLRATGSHADAEDLLSDLMLRLVRTLKDYDERGRFEPWLFRIAANMVRDRIRRRNTSPPPASLSTQGDSGRPLADEIAGKTAGVDANLLASEDAQRLQEALSKLDDTTREMILLRHYADMSFKEIAQLHQCPLGTALAKVHRGLKALRRWMGEENADE